MKFEIRIGDSSIAFYHWKIVHPQSFSDFPSIFHPHVSCNVFVELNERDFSSITCEGHCLLLHCFYLFIVCRHSFKALQAHSSNLLTKKIEKESVVCRRTALFLRDFRWQTRNTDNSGQTQRTARCIPRDKTGHKILEKAAVRTTWVESPYHIPLRSSFRTVETSRQMSAKVMP